MYVRCYSPSRKRKPSPGWSARVSLLLLNRTGDGPFRQTSAPIPGATGITVGRVSDERYGFTHVALDLWRPSIAYLLICVAIAAPALAALFSKQF